MDFQTDCWQLINIGSARTTSSNKMFKTEQLEYNIILQSDNFYRYPQNICRYTYYYNKEDLKYFYLICVYL